MEERYPRQYKVLRQLWMDLERVKRWQHVEPRENAKLGLCYLYGWVGGSESESAIPQIVVPCTTHEPLSMARMHGLLDELTHTSDDDPTAGAAAKPQLTLGFVANDSSLVYYRVTPDLAPPQP